MSTRYTRKDVRTVVASLESIAKTIELLPRNAELVYQAGNPTNGIPARIDCFDFNNGERIALSTRFIPEWTYKSNLREQFKTVEAACNALYAVAMKD